MAVRRWPGRKGLASLLLCNWAWLVGVSLAFAVAGIALGYDIGVEPLAVLLLAVIELAAPGKVGLVIWYFPKGATICQQCAMRDAERLHCSAVPGSCSVQP